MERRLKYAIGIVFVVLSLSLPNLLLAQGDLTLGNLAERVENLFSGQDNLKARVEAIETRLAPTPTKTKRPTPPATVTAQARATRNAARAQVTATARARSQARARITTTAQARATATARARVTATAQAQQGPTAAEIATYSLATEPVLALLKEGIFGVASLFEEPNFGNTAWEFKVEGFLHKIQESWFLALKIDHPSSLSAVHSEFMRGMDGCFSGANNALDGIVFTKPNLLEDAFKAFEKCAQHIEEASKMLDEMR